MFFLKNVKFIEIFHENRVVYIIKFSFSKFSNTETHLQTFNPSWVCWEGTRNKCFSVMIFVSVAEAAKVRWNTAATKKFLTEVLPTFSLQTLAFTNSNFAGKCWYQVHCHLEYKYIKFLITCWNNFSFKHIYHSKSGF